jgi:serine/threonine-protein kinase RsbT
VADEAHVAVQSDRDIILARQQGRDLALKAGFKGSDLTVIATAISEIARNIIVFAQRGDMTLSVIEKAGKRGVMVVAEDQGPGIPDIAQAMRDGFSTGKSLGLGLPGAKRLMDEFEIQSEVGKGTTITMRKWAR